MSTKHLSGNDQFVTNFLANNEQDDFVALNIVQNPEIPYPQFKLSPRIRSRRQEPR